jgi:serine O-acetyltransferase
MRLMRDLRFTLPAKLGSRMIRHVYAAELHWDAELAPGVMIVHGNGLVISHAAKVGTGCVLFQHVTLGESMHPETREVGAPVLEPDVHVGVGAVLLGPITIGRGTKIGPQCVLTRSVPAGCVVEPVPAVVQVRGRGVLPIRPGSPRGADAPSPATPAGGRAFS